jgi:hypothetical protein
MPQEKDVSKPTSEVRIDLGDLTEAVTRSIQRALGTQELRRFPRRIICGLILGPPSPLEKE